MMPPDWSYADLDLISGALLDAVDDYAERAAEELADSGEEAAAEWYRKSEQAEALFERVCQELDRLNAEREAAAARSRHPAGHGYTPATGPFATGDGCRVMLARYPCNYTREQHDPDLPPEELDVFGYRRSPRPCCPGAGTMAHVQGCANHPEAQR